MKRFQVRLGVTVVSIFAHCAVAQTSSPNNAKDDPADTAISETKNPVKGKVDSRIDTIEVQSSRQYDMRQEDTASRIVVTSAEINKFGDTQLADVLKRLPGITVQGTNIRMRGLGGGYTQILIDGERAPAGLTIDQIPPDTIERIEIIRAATAEFSTQAIAGTINIVMKKKVTIAQREFRTQYERGKFRNSPRLSFVQSDKDDTLSYSVTGYINRNSGRERRSQIETQTDSAGWPLLYRYSEDWGSDAGYGAGIDPRLVWTFKDGETLAWQTRLRTFDSDFANNSQYITAEGTPPPLFMSAALGRLKVFVVRTDLNWVRKLAEGAKLDTKLGFGIVSADTTDAINGYNTARNQNFDRIQKVDRDVREFSFTGKYTTPIVEGHALAAGWDTGVINRRETTTRRDKPFPDVLPQIPVSNSDAAYDATVLKMSAFAQDEWSVTKQWSMYLGLRWEGVNTTSKGIGFNSVVNRSSVWSPLMQTLYKLLNREGEQVRLALTRTYKSPTPSNLIPTSYLSVDNKPTSPDRQGNPNLRPELATGIDVAYEKFWGHGASIGLSGTVRRITGYNHIGLRLLNGRWVTLPINDGNATSRSVEFDSKASLGKIFPDAPAIDYRFNMNRNWSTVDAVPGPNNRLDQQTPFSATVGFDWRIKGGEFALGSSYSFRTGGTARTSITQESTASVKRELECYGLWKVSPKLQARVTVQNILHQSGISQEAYFDSAGRSQIFTNATTKPSVRLGVDIKL